MPLPPERTSHVVLLVDIPSDKEQCLRSIKASFSLIVAHFLPEIFYWLVQKTRSLSLQKNSNHTVSGSKVIEIAEFEI